MPEEEKNLVGQVRKEETSASDPLSKVTLQINELENKVRELQIKETKLLEILAIIFALFTFISTNVNIFTRVGDIYTAIWFMFLMTVCSLIIFGSLFFFIHNRGKWTELLLILLLLIAVILLLIVPNSDYLKLQLNPVTMNRETNGGLWLYFDRGVDLT